MIVVADTSALFAAFDSSQVEHKAARAVMLAEPLLASPLVLTELDHLAQRDLGLPALSRSAIRCSLVSPAASTG